jgi:hypothetical protein
MTDIDLDIESIDTEGDIGLSDEDRGKVNSNQVDWYKGETGRTDRVALVYFNNVKQTLLRRGLKANSKMTKDEQKALLLGGLQKLAEKLGKSLDQLDDVDMLDMGEARFRTLTSSYKQGLGYVEWPKNLTPEEEKVWKKLGDRKDYVCTLLLQYPTDKDGEVDRDRLAKGWAIKPWRFPAKIYEQIRKANRGAAEHGNSVSSIDLNIFCEDAKFQKVSVTSSGPCIYLKNDKFKRVVLEKAVSMYDKLSPFRQMTTDELREKLGLSGGGSSGGSSSDFGDDFGGVLGNV